MTTEFCIVAMTDPQLMNNERNSSGGSNNGNNGSSSSSSDNSTYSQRLTNNNNNHTESKYLHKKFKKIASSEVAASIVSIVDTSISTGTISESKDILSCSVEVFDSPKCGYVCPYCKISCAKPSVLQKHIRAHTNERPYPCVPCGFAFKTKSNLYKHCKSRTHILKTKEADTTNVIHTYSQLSEDSDHSLSDSASNDTDILTTTVQSQPINLINSQTFNPNKNPHLIHTTDVTKTSKIYKPKFHSTSLQQCMVSYAQILNKSHSEKLQEHLEHITIDNQHDRHNLFEPSVSNAVPLRKRCHSENSNNIFFCQYNTVHNITDNLDVNRCSYHQIQSKLESESEFKAEMKMEQDYYTATPPLPSPGPLLGNTRLVDYHYTHAAKRSKCEPAVSLRSLEHISKYPRLNTLQMFGGEVRILNKSGESKTVRIEPLRSSCSTSLSDKNCKSSETASVVVRSDLHSGGTMLHKIQDTEESEPKSTAELNASTNTTCINLANIVPNISPPHLAPSVSCLSYSKPANILHDGKLIPYVPGIPGPQTLLTNSEPSDVSSEINSQITVAETINRVSSAVVITNNVPRNSRFLRPSTLSLKPGTFTPKRHHGITPTANTLPLISPETPRPKKSYGQLYLNGHAYTYLGLKCSTRLFYCTLNRPQPMYVAQQHNLSMYSNWKICKEAPPELELVHYDSRYRSTGYTLAKTHKEDILTHSSQRPNTPSSPDSGLESDGQEKSKRIKIFSGGFESNEEYTYIRGRGRGRYVCEECGIRCKKPSMLKKHIRTHTDVRPYTCKHCAFSFKTKGNLTKHMKSKAHYKRCLELKVLPVPTKVCDNNVDKEALNRLALAGVNFGDTSSSEESEPESEEQEEQDDYEENDESGSEEQEAAEGLLWLARHNNLLPGLISCARPATYPYNIRLSKSLNKYHAIESRLSVIHSCKKVEHIIVPVDLTTKQSQDNHKTSKTNIFTEISDPELLQAIVQTTERLPIGNHNWTHLSTDPVEGQMLQAYLKERHVVDSKFKLQYQITSKETKESLKPMHSLTLPLLTPISSSSISPLSNRFNLPITVATINHVAESSTRSSQSGNLLPCLELVETKEEQISSPLQLKPVNDIKNKNLILAFNDDAKQQQHSLIQKVVVGESGFQSTSSQDQSYFLNSNPEFFQPLSTKTSKYVSVTEESRSICNICNKVFSKPSQLRLHINIHYFERPFKCESCGTSFRTKGHLTKHERSSLHHNKVSMTSTFGAATASNPRPFKCTDCKSAFRIHGHLAKHLRSKMHIMKLECLRKLPFGTYAEMERSGINLNDIDTTDCDSSLNSLRVMAQNLCEKESNELGQWEVRTTSNLVTSGGETSSDEGDNNSSHSVSQSVVDEVLPNRYKTMCIKSNNTSLVHEQVKDVKNNQIYICNRCSKYFENSNDLHVHCYDHHNLKSNETPINISTVSNEKITEKENHHCFKNIQENIIIERETGQKFDAT